MSDSFFKGFGHDTNYEKAMKSINNFREKLDKLKESTKKEDADFELEEQNGIL